MGTPSTTWREDIKPGEEAELIAVAEKLRGVQRARKVDGRASRALHAKGHIGAKATFEVRSDLPEHARQGLFATPGARFDALVRFSNGDGKRQHDGVGDVRGVAIKVLGVPGRKLIPGLEDAKTQDFLLIHKPTVPFRTPAEFVDFIVAASGSPLLLLPRFAAAVGFGRAFGLVRQLLPALKEQFPTFAGRTFYSAAPTAYGPYAVKYVMTASGGPFAPPVPKRPLADDLAARLAEGPLSWDFGIQLHEDEAKTPIEDSTVEWTVPVLPVARLEVQKQDVRSPEGEALSARVEQLSFDPWHALPAHRPVGQVMRARNHAYRLSTEERGAAPEPE